MLSVHSVWRTVLAERMGLTRLRRVVMSQQPTAAQCYVLGSIGSQLSLRLLYRGTVRALTNVFNDSSAALRS